MCNLPQHCKTGSKPPRFPVHARHPYFADTHDLCTLQDDRSIDRRTRPEQRPLSNSRELTLGKGRRPDSKGGSQMERLFEFAQSAPSAHLRAMSQLSHLPKAQQRDAPTLPIAAHIRRLKAELPQTTLRAPLPSWR